MTKFRLFRIKNAMLFANFISNFIGVLVILFIIKQYEAHVPPEIVDLGKRIDVFFLPCSFFLGLVPTLIYERPIRRYLNMRFREEPAAREFTDHVRQRLLNEPFFLIALDFGIWLLAALLYSFLFWSFDADRAVIHRTFFNSLRTGLITTTVAFFVFEFVLQRRIVPHFFPNGGLYTTPRTLRIRIGTRLIALLFACNLVPFVSIINLSQESIQASSDPVHTVEHLSSTMLRFSMIFMAVGIWLTFLVSHNLTRPLHEIIRVLRRVRHGDFDQNVRVTSNDEIGYTGDVINEMTQGLKERDFIKETFGKYVANEIRDEILSGKVSLDGELKEVTVLFADLRNFTPMVESTPPKDVVKIINGYFAEMEEAIHANNGLVMQYIGDEIEAVFGAPIFREDHPAMAVHAALEMNEKLLAVNKELERNGYAPLSHGIGIHTGKVLAANIGSPNRLSYALVGDTVNLASRLQGLTKEFGTEIILSGATRARLNNGFPLKALPATKVKGKSDPVEIYALAT